MSNLQVIKRNSTREPFSADKINRLLEWACDGLDAKATDVAVQAHFSVFDGVSTADLHQVLIEAAEGLISVETPDYQFVAGRLLLAQLRKQTWGSAIPPGFNYMIQGNQEMGVYADWITEKYSHEEIEELGAYINHDRDFRFTYAGLRQLMSKYLIIDRTTGYIYETPQFAYMLVAMGLLQNKPKEERLQWVKETYDGYSEHRTNLPTPTMAGVRSRVESYASCALIEVDDSLDSIMSNLYSCAKAVSGRYGLGLDMSSIRGIGAGIRNGESIHSGVIPFLKVYAATIRGLYQGGVRQGSATVCFNWWHWEIEDILMLRSITGSDEARVRNLDYCINFCTLFEDRVVKGENVTLFSPEEVPELLDSFGFPHFRALYESAEKRPGIRKRVVPARRIIDSFLLQRYETSRIYCMFIDRVNVHVPWKGQVRTTNLCTEILDPLIPARNMDDPDAESGVCILSAGNTIEMCPMIDGRPDFGMIPQTMREIVNMLDGSIDVQNYFSPAAERFAKRRRSLGVGITNLAAYFARMGLTYDSPEAPNEAARLMEAIEYHLLVASNELAQKIGPCEAFNETKWSDGVLPIDTYCRAIDEFVTEPLHQDWEGLRAKILQYGLRNSTLTAIMPAESSSVIQNSTNGIEPIKALLSGKQSKSAGGKQLVPGAGKWHYQMAFDKGVNGNQGRMRVAAALQKFTDMGISLNTYHNPSHHAGGVVPMKVLYQEWRMASRYGLQTLYYNLADDGDVQTVEATGCESGACSI